jgi:hypothetical protein
MVLEIPIPNLIEIHSVVLDMKHTCGSIAEMTDINQLPIKSLSYSLHAKKANFLFTHFLATKTLRKKTLTLSIKDAESPGLFGSEQLK